MARLREILFADEPTKTQAQAQRQMQQQEPASAQTLVAPVANKPAERRELSLSKQLTTIKAKGAGSVAESGQAAYQQLKTRIHTRLVESLDLNALMRLDGNAELETAIEQTVHMLINEERLPLSAQERQHIAQDVLYETLGLGPLEPLLADGEINDILVNGANSVWIDRNGQLAETEVRFQDDNHLLHVINRIVSRVGRRVDESSPIVDARLPDGSRVNAIIPPLSIEGPILSIRRFRPNPFNLNDLMEKGTLSPQMAEFLENAVRGRLNILISGGTSAGKTTLLGVLSSYISERERIVTIEDTAELRLQQRHVVRLESRPSNIEGQGAVNQRELVKNALRMRPDRIVVGEVRGAEALDMLQAMNTGHEGSLTTVHANSARDALSRLETLVLLGGVDLSQRSIREQMGSAFDLIVQIKRLSDGTRRIVSVTEVTGVQEDVVSLQDIFEYRQTGTSPDGKVQGMHVACGIRPSCESKLKEAGLQLSSDLFLETAEESASNQDIQDGQLLSQRGRSND